MESNKKVKVCDEKGPVIITAKQVELKGYLHEALTFLNEDADRKTKEDSKRKKKKYSSIQFEMLKHMLLLRSMIECIDGRKDCVSKMAYIIDGLGEPFSKIPESIKTFEKKSLNEYKEKRVWLNDTLIKIVKCMKEVHTEYSSSL